MSHHLRELRRETEGELAVRNDACAYVDADAFLYENTSAPSPMQSTDKSAKP